MFVGGSRCAPETKAAWAQRGSDPVVVSGLQQDSTALRSELFDKGFRCGHLRLAGQSGKRQVWTDGAVVIRVSTSADVLRNGVDAEIDWARRIGAVVPAQVPLAGPVPLLGAIATIWEWLDGAPATPEHAVAHGALLRTLHDRGGIPPRGAAPVDQLDSARSRLSLIRDGILRPVLAVLVEHAATVLRLADSGRLVLSHGDAHDRNLLVVDGVVHLLDFDSAGWAERHVDVASGMYAWRYNHHSEVAVQSFLDGYGPHPSLPDGRLDALVWVRRVRATCTRAAAGENVDARVEELRSTRP
jgi:aminoglycoside phosphotransferase (APT) family kinase protein